MLLFFFSFSTLLVQLVLTYQHKLGNINASYVNVSHSCDCSFSLLMLVRLTLFLTWISLWKVFRCRFRLVGFFPFIRLPHFWKGSPSPSCVLTIHSVAPSSSIYVKYAQRSVLLFLPTPVHTNPPTPCRCRPAIVPLKLLLCLQPPSSHQTKKNV